MITSFFKSTKPFHSILVTLLLLILFCFYRKDIIFHDLSFSSLSTNFLLFLALLFTIAVQSFLVSKNNLTQKSSFNTLLFVLFLAIIPATFKDSNVILANLFIVLALRRLVSLKSNIAVKKKLFDAAFWIGIASLFYFWSILFFLLILFALLLFALGQLKNWIIPFVALIVIAISLTSYSLLFNDTILFLEDYIQILDFNITNYNSSSLVLGLTIIVTVILWSSFFYLKTLREMVRIKRSVFVVILYSLLIAIVIVIISPNKNGSEFIFLFTPLAIITTNYLETIEDSWFGEVFMWLLALTSVAILMLQFYTIS